MDKLTKVVLWVWLVVGVLGVIELIYLLYEQIGGVITTLTFMLRLRK